jgi:hypothetical protein
MSDKISIREDLVKQGLRFLQHPKVQQTPLSERLAFLEKKGLTPQVMIILFFITIC